MSIAPAPARREIRLTDLIIPRFYAAHADMRTGAASEIWLRGGRCSTKSSFAALEIVYGIMQDPQANALCLRKYAKDLRDSVLTTIGWAIEMLGVSDRWQRTIAPMGYTYLPTGQEIKLRGLDSALKLRSIKPRQGYFKFLWFEEAVEFHGRQEIEDVQRSVQRGGDHFIQLVTYNPPNDPAAWVNEECLIQVAGRRVYSSTYLDVPPEWLGTRQLEIANNLKARDEMEYRHVYLGEVVGRAEQIVFHGKWESKEFSIPEGLMYQRRYFYGVDWGFSVDPLAVVRCFIVAEPDGLELYIDHEAGGTHIDMDAIGSVFRSIPKMNSGWPIFADNARPETISYLARQGWNIEGAEKWTGSVEDGVTYLRGFRRIYIHPRCTQTVHEFQKYSYKVDKMTQRVLPVLEEGNDHYIDAIRYALYEYIKRKVSIFDAL